MDARTTYPDLSRLIALLESLYSATHEVKIGVEANCADAQLLLTGWTLPGNDSVQDIPACNCSDAQKQQLHHLLDKVEKAVKYSQSVREGRNDVKSPWDDEKNGDLGNKPDPITVKKMSSRSGIKSAPPFRKSSGIRDKPSSKMSFGPKRNSGISDNVLKKKLHDSDEKNRMSADNLPCPLHGTGQAENSKPENPSTVELAEALDVVGIPPELVSILKAVHRFLERLRSSRSKNKAESAFLRRLNAHNENAESYISPVTEFSQNFTPSKIKGEVPMMNMADSQSAELRSLRQRCVGVWNAEIFEAVADGSLCVQYQDEETWVSLQTRLHQLQLSHCELKILDRLMSDVLPHMLELRPWDPAGPSYVKAASALSRLSSLSLPTLVQTSQV